MDGLAPGSRFAGGANVEARDERGHWHLGTVQQSLKRGPVVRYKRTWSRPFTGQSSWRTVPDGVRAVTSDRKRALDNDQEVYGNVDTRQDQAGAVSWTVDKLVAGPRRRKGTQGEEWRVRAAAQLCACARPIVGPWWPRGAR